MIRKLALLLLCAGLAAAQLRITSARAGAIFVLQGLANIDGKPVTVRGGFPAQMQNGQRVHVDWGRLEVKLGPGAAVTMTQGSTLRMLENHLDDIRVELEQGSALVRVDQVYKGWRLRVVVPGGAAELHAGGWYRFLANPQGLRVYKGNAEVALADSVIKAKKGQAVNLSGSASSGGALSAFDLKETDPLVAWELQRDRDAETRQKRLFERSAIQRVRREMQRDRQQEIDQDRKRSPQTLSQAPAAQ